MLGFWVMLKMNLKLLLRNKGYLFCIILIPLVSVFMLNLSGVNGKSVDVSDHVHEWKDADVKLSNNMDNLMVKVCDSSNSPSSDYLIQELVNSGLYEIYKLDTSDEEFDEAVKDAASVFESSTIRAILYIPSDFNEHAVKEDKINLKLYYGYEDPRVQLLSTDIQSICQVLSGVENKDDLVSLEKNEMKESVSVIKQTSKIDLTEKQMDDSSRMGYSIVFMTVSFLFSGVFIAMLIIQERENKTMDRLAMSKSTLGCYFLVKFLLAVATTFVQTFVIGIGIFALVKMEFGVPVKDYLFMAFMMGILLNLLSVVIGIIVDNVMVTIIISFLMYALSSLFAGLYFPLSEEGFYGSMAKLFPQYWMLTASKMLMAGDSNAYGVYLTVIGAFLIILTTLGIIGIRLHLKSQTE